MISVKQVVVLHTGRSRNDQCAVDLHMYVRKAVVEMGELIVDMQKPSLKRLKNTAMLSCPAIRIYNGHNLYCWSSYDGILLYARTRL